VINLLQGSAVTKTALGGLSISSLVANFLQCTTTKNYESWLTADKVIAIITRNLLGIARNKSHDAAINQNKQLTVSS